MSANERSRRAPQPGPVRLDAALAETLHLLELVRQEEQVLARLTRCVADLHAISRARAALSARTRAELTEATAAFAVPVQNLSGQRRAAASTQKAGVPDHGAAR